MIDTNYTLANFTFLHSKFPNQNLKKKKLPYACTVANYQLSVSKMEMVHVDQIYISLPTAQQACVFFFALFKTTLMVFYVCFLRGNVSIGWGLRFVRGVKTKYCFH